MVTSIDHRAHMFKGATDGLAQAYTETTIAAMTLGVVGKTRFHKKALAYNEMIKSTGVMLGIVTFGFASYAVYPNIRNVFYQNIYLWVLHFCCRSCSCRRKILKPLITILHGDMIV